jgi:P pilus assembly chaperone PapD
MNRTPLYLCFILLLFRISLQSGSAQVSLAPIALFIPDKTNVTSLYVNNNSQAAQEVSVSFEFAYPGSDALGNMIPVNNDSVSAIRYDLMANIRVFPRQFLMQPGGQQVIRLQVRPMQSKPDGVYWSRVIVSSQSAAKDIDTMKVSEGIVTKINYVFRQNIPVFYLKGKLNTGLTPGTVTTSMENGKLIAISRLTPTGNAPYNGSVTARLLNSAGKEVAASQQTVVAYFEVLRRIELTLPKEGLNFGKYTLEFTYETKRIDISPSDLVQAKPVKQIVAVEIK